MKLLIRLDAAAAFDMLSILQVKIYRVTDMKKCQQAIKSFLDIGEDLCSQLGDEKVNEILLSSEYDSLYKANEKVFDSVDIAEDINRQDEISAYEVAQLNLLRYKCKNKLQTKFFNVGLEEVKSGEYAL